MIKSKRIKPSLILLYAIFCINFVYSSDQPIKEQLALGNTKSNIEIFVVSDWFCPSCKKAESKIEQIYNEFKSEATFYFVDFAINRQSGNFTPYHVAFEVNDKPNYIKARTALLELTKKTETPKDSDVEKIAEKSGLTLKELSYTDIKKATTFFDSVVDKYDLSATPAIIVVNKKTDKSELIKGSSQINKQHVKEAITKLQ